MNFILSIPKNIAIAIVTLYQKTLSPDHGLFKSLYPYGYCKHYPTCSEYTKQALDKHGLVKGGFYGALRILRCNPWAESKVDPIP